MKKHIFTFFVALSFLLNLVAAYYIIAKTVYAKGIETGVRSGFDQGFNSARDQIFTEIVRQYKQGLVEITDKTGTDYKLVPKK